MPHGFGKLSLLIGISLIAFACSCCDCIFRRSSSLKAQDEVIETVYVSLKQLPRKFEDSMMLRRWQRSGAEAYPHIGSIDRLFGFKPLSTFETGVEFYGSHLKGEPKISFKRTINCIIDTNICDEYPFDLNELIPFMNPMKRTLIIVGGYLAQAPTDWQQEIAGRWRMLEDLNIITFGWNKANRVRYSTAVGNIPIVARQMTVFLHYIAELNGMTIKDPDFAERIMFVGHSLGAHVSGFVGQDFAGHIGRITGLDPAGPMFKAKDTDQRLDRSDALLVDVIHTNADDAWNFFLGLYQPIGHLDYYANNGKWQPSCPLIGFFSCNHGAVKHYYVSVLDHEFTTRNNFEHEARDQHRLFGHLSETYEDFRSGRSMFKNCPVMMSDSDHPELQNGYDITRCTVPMDFVKPVRELKAELERDFGIDFGPDQKPNKYFFFTSPDRPFVNDHNLLKIKFESERTLPKCKSNYHWEFKFIMARGETSSIQLERDQQIERLDANAQRVAIPFLALTRTSKYFLSEFDKASDKLDHNNENDRVLLHKTIKQTMPSIIEIKASGVDVQELTDNSVRPEKEPSCTARLESVRVIPVKNLRRPIVGIYSLAAEMQQVPKIQFLEPNEPVPSISVFPGDTKPDATRGLKLYLDTVIIGPPLRENKEAKLWEGLEYDIDDDIFEQANQ